MIPWLSERFEMPVILQSCMVSTWLFLNLVSSFVKGQLSTIYF